MNYSDLELYYELTLYTLSHQSENFIHQYVMDAFTAQNATENTPAITLFFALAGLYLHLEKGYNGKLVQEAHLIFSRKTKKYPFFTLPEFRGEVNINNVIASKPGVERDCEIENWSKCVWNCYKNEREKIILLTENLL